MGMSIKTKINIALKCIFFTLTVGVILYGATVVLERKDSLYKYADFFDMAEKDQIDVLFIGSSHVINAINPTVLYKEHLIIWEAMVHFFSQHIGS